MDISTAQPVVEKTEVTAAEIPHLLDLYATTQLSVLSLDCFDTLLWRKTAAPKDVFYEMQHRPLFKSLGVTAYQRMAAAGRATREKFIKDNTHQVSLKNIYHHHTHLSPDQKMALAREELLAEIEACYVFPPFIDLIKAAKARGMKVIIVSDIYFTEAELRQLLAHHLPDEAMNAIDQIFCSVDYGQSKSESLFNEVLKKMGGTPDTYLHIGDHQTADFESPRRLGIHALHFSQFGDTVTDLLRLQHSAASLAHLAKMEADSTKEARVSPFRGVFSMRNPLPKTPETLIGYLSFGPMLFAFAKFITDELNELKQSGKQIKPYFLLRDAYLLYKACETYAGEPLGELARIRKFVAVAASFRTQEDIDFYMSSIIPYYYNFWVICEQLLLPTEMTQSIIQTANAAKNPQSTFNALIHEEGIQKIIFENSAKARRRLIKYMKKHMHVNENDMLVLIDTGYHGVTQTFLTRALKGEMNIEIIGRYFIASHEPDRPECKSLITTTWCEHGLFEQCCTFKEGAVSGYDEQGDPVFDAIKISDAQYQKVDKVQAESLKFISDAKQFFNKTHTEFPLSVFQQAALASLNRQIFFPTPDEVLFFNDFQHDKDMGHDNKKTIFHIQQCNDHLRETYTPYGIHPYAERAINLDLSLSSLMKRAFDLDFKPEEKSYYRERVSVVSLQGDLHEKIDCEALPTKDGYYTFTFNSLACVYLGLVFGESYQWVEISNISLKQNPGVNLLLIDSLIVLNDMNKNKTLFECLSKNAYLMLNPLNSETTVVTYQVTFRPIIRWSNN